MAKLSINLLQPELLPEQPLWTLTRVVSLWAFVFVGMVAWYSWSTSELTATLALQNQSTQQKNTLDKQKNLLEQQVAANKADPVLIEQLETTKLLLENKNSLHQQLTDTTSTYAAGFSRAMSELSELHHRDISLQNIAMNGPFIKFSGLAKSPQSVPTWLAGFEGTTFLSGHTFNHFRLVENEQNLTEFVVSSTKEQEGGQ